MSREWLTIAMCLILHACSAQPPPHQASFDILFAKEDGASAVHVMDKLAREIGESYDTAEFPYDGRGPSQLVYELKFSGNVASIQTATESHCDEHPPSVPSFSRKHYTAILSAISEQELRRLKSQVQLAASAEGGTVFTEEGQLCKLKKQGKW